MAPWLVFVVIGLLIWRVVYAVRRARHTRAAFSRWTDPWIW